jgi:hypothetical protein
MSEVAYAPQRSAEVSRPAHDGSGNEAPIENGGQRGDGFQGTFVEGQSTARCDTRKEPPWWHSSVTGDGFKSREGEKALESLLHGPRVHRTRRSLRTSSNRVISKNSPDADEHDDLPVAVASSGGCNTFRHQWRTVGMARGLIYLSMIHASLREERVGSEASRQESRVERDTAHRLKVRNVSRVARSRGGPF